MTSRKSGPQPVIPETPCMGWPLKSPTQIPTVQSGVNPTVQLSLKSFEVPVLAAAGKGRLRAVL